MEGVCWRGWERYFCLVCDDVTELVLFLKAQTEFAVQAAMGPSLCVVEKRFKRGIAQYAIIVNLG